MNKKQKLISLISIGIFLLITVICASFVPKVGINYSISDYLDENTDTKIALQIIEDEFGMTTDIKVMIKDIEVKDVKTIVEKIEKVDKVLTVTFKENDPNYYKDNTALISAMIDSDDYSEVTRNTVSEIKGILSEYWDGEIYYGGTSIDKITMRETITSEMVVILGVALGLVVLILLLMATSWMEPVVLLLAAGIAIVINLGTNVILGEISYITNSVTAILQLALSIDYSIVLLHTYRDKKQEIENSCEAMKETIKSVIRPVSASAMTTLAGLLALLFMSFKIGFDIGTVLMKGIVVSAVISITLFPLFILVFEKLMNKTSKPALKIEGKIFCTLANKLGKVIVPLFAILVIVSFLFSNKAVFVYSEPSTSVEIDNTFGINNTVILVYENQENNDALENQLIERLSELKLKDGTPVLISHTAYSNTVNEVYDVEKLVNKLSLEESMATNLLTMYHLYQNPDSIKMTTNEFINYSKYLLENDADAGNFTSGLNIDVLDKMLSVYNVTSGKYTASEFHTLMTSGAMEGTELSLFAIEQMYGLYFYNEVKQQAVDFRTMLNHMINGDISSSIGENATSQLETLVAGIKAFNAQMDQTFTKTALQYYLGQNYGISLSEEQVNNIYNNYFASINKTPEARISFLPLMTYLIKTNVLTDQKTISMINNYNELYDSIRKSYEFDEFLPALNRIATLLSGKNIQINAGNDEMQQVYISYFKTLNLIPDGKISGREFVDYVLELSTSNTVVAGQMGDNKGQLLDMVLIDEFMKDSNKYAYADMTEKLNTLQESVSSVESKKMSSDKISGVYIKYAIKENLNKTDGVVAKTLVDFVLSYSKTNELMISMVTDEKLETLNAAKEDIDMATDLFKSENYSRLLISLRLDSEGEDTEKFMVEALTIINEIFGEKAYLAGEIPSTYDLKETFEFDNTFITIFTIISIFVIVMVIFKSISIPTILVIVIQGSIWFMMTLLFLFNKNVFFMSYIISTCILMGATIDYGILMSSNYSDLRTTLNPKEALLGAVKAAMPTVFTSGTILSIAGIVISFISSQNSIATVGLLVGIGALCSTLFITVVLPSLLYILDKFVLVLTLKRKTK
ncbi:MAG: MMPL family transporter [Bacilli bacterium]|nr:MMPL family transporter [Bacilli bacterium]